MDCCVPRTRVPREASNSFPCLGNHLARCVKILKDFVTVKLVIPLLRLCLKGITKSDKDSTYENSLVWFRRKMFFTA